MLIAVTGCVPALAPVRGAGMVLSSEGIPLAVVGLDCSGPGNVRAADVDLVDATIAIEVGNPTNSSVMVRPDDSCCASDGRPSATPRGRVAGIAGECVTEPSGFLQDQPREPVRARCVRTKLRDRARGSPSTCPGLHLRRYSPMRRIQGEPGSGYLYAGVHSAPLMF